jgi:tRNA dimethylallyltransferase
VDERIEAMFENGFIEEVKGLLARGYPPSLPTMSAIGYRECVQALEGRITTEEAKQLIRRATRVFVRRQANWFKESDPDISWFRVADGIVDDIEKNIRRAVDF